MIPAPIVSSSLSVPQPGCAGYRETRRGMPSLPRKNIGKKVKLVPTTISAQWSFPSRSRSMAPVIFGNQW